MKLRIMHFPVTSSDLDPNFVRSMVHAVWILEAHMNMRFLNESIVDGIALFTSTTMKLYRY